MPNLLLRSRLRYWLAVIVSLQMVDALTTIYGLSSRHAVIYEQNPIGAVLWMNGHAGSILLMKAVALPLVALILLLVDRIGSRGIRLTYCGVAVAISLFLAANNVIALVVTR